MPSRPGPLAGLAVKVSQSLEASLLAVCPTAPCFSRGGTTRPGDLTPQWRARQSTSAASREGAYGLPLEMAAFFATSLVQNLRLMRGLRDRDT